MTSTDLREHPLVRELLMLGLPMGDYVIFGSAPMLAHGIRAQIGDLDVVARGAAWRRAESLGVPARGEVGGEDIVRLADGAIEIAPRWFLPGMSADDLIARTEIVAGLPFASLADVVAYKQVLGRPKDLVDVARIEAHLRRGRSCAAPAPRRRHRVRRLPTHAPRDGLSHR